MGDSIYTILIIGWIAYGIFSAVKKSKAKANPAASPPPPRSQATTIDSVFESIFQEQSSVAPVASHPYSEDNFEEDYEENFVSESTDSSQEQVYNYEEDYLDTVPEANAESELDTYSGTDNIESSIVFEEEKDEIQKSAIGGEDEENTHHFNFNLRRAIIAKAVLDRPYE